MPQVNGQEVGPTGYGLMGLTWRAQPPSQEQAFEAMRAALRNGCNFWNGGEFYGPPDYNSLVLLERYFEKYPEDANKVVICIKGAVNTKTHKVDGSAEQIRRSMESNLKQLNGRKKLDLFECARRDPNTPLEETFGTLQREYIDTGMLGGIMLTEVSAATIHEAVKITKIAAVEVELSLFSTDVLHNGVAAACAQYNIPLVAYSPIGRGMLTGHLKSLADLPEGDLRASMGFPRFQPGHFEANLKLVEKVEQLANKKGCTPGQLAINWVKSLSKRPGMPVIIPIPGATTAERVNENAVEVDLGEEDLTEIDAILATFETSGDRYPAGSPTNT